ncbi:hypothetical protein F5883DRAFT_516036 [Diaporthe sp. PMI_573]|nr:hypothetical protein F5883DRAFT_516036 [Diaporthaceae sp. PMI_573]
MQTPHKTWQKLAELDVSHVHHTSLLTSTAVSTKHEAMPARHKNHKDCSQCGHFRTWRVNKTFVRATKTFGGEKKYFQTCNRCSCLYRKKGPLTKAEFRKKYGGSDHADSDPEDGGDDNEDGDDNTCPEPNNDSNHDQGGSPGQGGVGQAITAA